MQMAPVEFVQFLRVFEVVDGWPAIVLLGVFAGFLVRFTTSSERRIGFWSTCLFGVAGAVIGVGAARWFGLALPGPGTRFLAALAGSVVLAVLGGMLRRGKASPP